MLVSQCFAYQDSNCDSRKRSTVAYGFPVSDSTEGVVLYSYCPKNTETPHRLTAELWCAVYLPMCFQ